MDNKQDEDFDLVKRQRELIRQREQKWGDFFDKYEGMNDVMENEELSDYSEAELTSNESYSAEEEVVDEIEEEDAMSDADSVIEVSDEDENVSNLTAALREVAQHQIKILNKTYEEHTSTDIKTKDKIESHRKSIKTTYAKAEIPALSTMSISNTLQSVDNMYNPNTTGNENSMVLASATQGLAADDTFSNVVSAVNEATKCQVIKQQGNVKIIQQTTITTTTTTTTETRTVQQIIDQDENWTPKKAILANPENSTKKKRKSNESVFPDYVEDDNGFTTPTTDRRKTRILNTPSRSATIEIPLTPSGSRNVITKMDIMTKLNEIIPNSAEKCPTVMRKVRAEEGARLSVMITPQRTQAIMPADASGGDPLFALLQTPQRPVLAKTLDDNGYQ